MNNKSKVEKNVVFVCVCVCACVSMCVCGRNVCLSVWCVAKCWDGEKGGSLIVSGMEGGLEGQVWNPEVKAEI